MSIDTSKLHTRQRNIALATAAISVLVGGLQLFFYLTGYEFDIGLYRHGFYPTLTALLWLISGAAVVAYSMTLPQKGICEELILPHSSLLDFTALIATASLAGLLFTIFLFRNSPADQLILLLNSTLETDSTARSMLLLSLAAAIPSIIHFVLLFYKRVNHPLGITALLLFVSFSALQSYSDMRTLLMSPRRVLHLMALLAVMLFLIAELRMARGLCGSRFYFASASLTVVFAFGDAFSNLALSLFGWQTLGTELTIYFFLLSIALFAFSRIFSFIDNDTNSSKTVITLVYPDGSEPSETDPDQDPQKDLSTEGTEMTKESDQ
ncbi:MAG: hypothetical protein IJ955_06730 [Oscillospiraceae bacterium]|nr:hypothetical protein [Oscillospiraceae bacterium]